MRPLSKLVVKAALAGIFSAVAIEAQAEWALGMRVSFFLINPKPTTMDLKCPLSIDDIKKDKENYIPIVADLFSEAVVGDIPAPLGTSTAIFSIVKGLSRNLSDTTAITQIQANPENINRYCWHGLDGPVSIRECRQTPQSQFRIILDTTPGEPASIVLDTVDGTDFTVPQPVDPKATHPSIVFGNANGRRICAYSAESFAPGVLVPPKTGDIYFSNADYIVIQPPDHNLPTSSAPSPTSGPHS